MRFSLRTNGTTNVSLQEELSAKFSENDSVCSLSTFLNERFPTSEISALTSRVLQPDAHCNSLPSHSLLCLDWTKSELRFLQSDSLDKSTPDDPILSLAHPLTQIVVFRVVYVLMI